MNAEALRAVVDARALRAAVNARLPLADSLFDEIRAASVAEVGSEIFDKFLAVASGEATKSEAQGLGTAEFIPWQVGAVM